MVPTNPSASSKPLWTPPAELIERCDMGRMMRDVGAQDYNELWEWSVEDVGRFWQAVWRLYGIQADGDPSVALVRGTMPGVRWFPDVNLSYAEHVFYGKDPDAVAVRFAGEERPLTDWTWARLGEETARVRAGLVGMGVRRGDRVVAYLPNAPETLAAFLATASLGAIWSCCSPDFGARTVIDRFAQIEPKVLLAVDGYRYGGKPFDRTAVVDELESALSTLTYTARLRLPGEGWDHSFPETDEPLSFERVPFDHPLWVVYSSGTTGLPKAIVHGHGGPLLEHLKTWRLHHDAQPDDRIFWFTTTGWVMWNYLVGALLSPVSVILYDGNPGHPHLGVLWDLIDEADASIFGAGAAYFHACMRAELQPRDGRDLSQLRAIGATGSPLAPEAYHWVAERVGAHVWLSSTSGGTDIAGGFVGGAPLMPVYAGELPARMLGVAVEAWDDDGRSVKDEVGELVVTKPMPSMPVCFWNDPEGKRYHESYFSMFPGVWRHGDWIRITSRGSAVVYGRSDSTINRGGIRMGTAEIYTAVEAHPSISAAVAVDVPSADGTGDGWLGLFVVLADGRSLTEELVADLRRRIRTDCSPRHVPDEIFAVPDVPRTLTGKLVEVPIKKMLMGRAAGEEALVGSLANPEAWQWFAGFAAGRRKPVSASV